MELRTRAASRGAAFSFRAPPCRTPGAGASWAGTQQLPTLGPPREGWPFPCPKIGRGGATPPPSSPGRRGRRRRGHHGPAADAASGAGMAEWLTLTEAADRLGWHPRKLESRARRERWERRPANRGRAGEYLIPDELL